MIRNIFITIVALCCMCSLNSQECASGSFGNAHIPAGGFMSIFANHTFVNGGTGFLPGIIETNRVGVPGFINFTSTGSWTGASDDAHVDGYVRTFSSGSFVFPTGNGERLRMIGISGSENATAVFIDEDPAIATGTMDIGNIDLESVSNREYWILTGEEATTVTLTWDQLTNVEDLVTGDINRLTIVGWTGSSWEIIPTSINEFMLAANSSNTLDENISTSFSIGSMVSDNLITPDDYEFLTLGSLAVPRSIAVGESSLTVYPNPAHIGDRTSIAFDLIGTRGKLEVYDGFQRMVYQQLIDRERGVITLPQLNLTDDKYVVTIIEADGSKTSKIMIMLR